MGNYGIFAMGLFLGIFAGFFIVGVLNCLAEAGELRQAGKMPAAPPMPPTAPIPRRVIKPDDFEPVPKVNGRLICLKGGKK